MLKVKKSVMRLISSIYECQKHIIINRRFIQEFLTDGNGQKVSGLLHEINSLQEKIKEFQKELSEKFKYSY